MNKSSNDARSQTGQRTAEPETTRRAVLAAGGAVALSGLAGCASLDGLVGRGSEQLVGTTVSAPAAFYPGRPPTTASTSSANTQEQDESHFVGTGAGEVKRVPATVQAEGQGIELEGWSTSALQKSVGRCCVGKAFAGKPPNNRPKPPQRPDDDADDNDVDVAKLVEYLEDEPTIAERFTVCLPDASLPGDRGSLAAELTPGRVLGYFAASYEEGGRHTPFHNKYRPQGIEYDDDGCVRTDGPVSLHRELACQEILSAKLDTYRTANRAIVGYSTEAGAVVSGALESADTAGKCVFVAGDGTLREPTSLDSWGPPVILDTDSDDDGLLESVSPTLVCPVAVTPEDCPGPLPGLFYVRRIVHDEQLIFAGGWMLDEGAIYEDSVTLLFDEGPTEVASVTPEDVESDDLDDRIVEQFSRGRSQLGSMVISGEIADDDSVPEALAVAIGGKKGYDVYMRKKIRDPDSDGDGLSDGEPFHASVSALDAPLVHLAGAGELSDEEKLEAATGRIETGVINSGEEVDILGMGAEK